MVQIRQAQLDAMSHELEERFVARMVRHLHDDFPEQCRSQGLTEERLEALTREGMARAAAYRVVDEADVQLYLECMVLLGSRFDVDRRFPWAGEILPHEGLTGTEKMDQVHDHLLFSLEPPV